MIEKAMFRGEGPRSYWAFFGMIEVIPDSRPLPRTLLTERMVLTFQKLRSDGRV
jgi:hypothetical protein